MSEFWNQNINPITMFGVVSSSKVQRQNGGKKSGDYVKNEELEGYAIANDLREELKITAKKLVALMAQFDVVPKYNNGKTYYKKDRLEDVRFYWSENKPKPAVDLSNYISTQELMKMFGYDTNKAFYITNKTRLKKTNFGKNVNYYEREKAIEAFKNYKNKNHVTNNQQ